MLNYILKNNTMNTTEVTLVKYKSNFKIIAILNGHSRLIEVGSTTLKGATKYAEKIANNYNVPLKKETCKNDYISVI